MINQVDYFLKLFILSKIAKISSTYGDILKDIKFSTIQNKENYQILT